ncbi:MAG: beta-ketoacyl-ACP synthase II [bacterium]|nr:beta-ketoacyl-ACP synthase II [bacterium]
MGRRVVITGIGVYSPIGIGKDRFLEALRKGENGVSFITLFDVSDYPVKIGAEVKDFNPLAYLDKKDVKRMDRFCQFALCAAYQAMEDSHIRLEVEDRDRIGVCVGSGIGGISTIEREHKILLEKGPRRVSPFLIPMLIIDIASGLIAIRFGVKGPNTACVTACASGAHAIGDAFEIIKRGDADLMIAGGVEAAITPLGFAGFCSAKALSLRNDPRSASRPFDLKRDGFVMGEGAGIVILEELNHARSRGAHIYAEIIGYGMSGDAYHITAPDPTGSGAYRAMKEAISSAGLKKEEVDYINAHGTSTRLNDKCETRAIKLVFGEHAYRIPISSTKSMIGHLLGAAGAVELIACCMMLEYRFIHPTINYEYFDPECDLDYVPNKRRDVEINIALSNSLGFGGHNASLIIKRYKDG